MRDAIKKMLIAEEDIRPSPYDCKTGKAVLAPVGKVTIGVGRNLIDNPLSEEEIFFLLDNDITRIWTAAVEMFPGYSDWKQGRQLALLNMIFQLGVGGVCNFRDMLECIDRGDWDGAAREVLDSDLARNDTPARARRVSEMFRTGEHPYG